MKILNSDVEMKSTHYYSETFQQTMKLNYWVGDRGANPGNQQPEGSEVSSNEALIVEISDQALSAQKSANNVTSYELSEKDKIKVRLIEKFIEILTGKKYKINLMEIKLDDNPSNLGIALQTKTPQPLLRNGWGLEFDFSEKYSEKEAIVFNTHGSIITADGKEINFSLDLKISRSYSKESNLSIRAGDALKKDPLVINYSGRAVELTNTRFKFDLDSDGNFENIYFARPGSGFLALDVNDDGKINDGRELFGPASSDGFSDLAKYDEDRNNWIDQQDPIYAKLKLWSRDDNGRDYLVPLEEQGIEAIYLGRIATPFSLKTEQNELKADISSTGIFITRDKRAGTVQQLNLTV